MVFTTADSAPLASTGVDPQRARHWNRTFLVMCLAFGVNHATVTTPIGYASSLLGNKVGNICNALLYASCMLSALFLGPIVGSFRGPKLGLLFGMSCYVIYVLCFAISLFFDKESTGQSTVAIIGAIIGGVGAGTLWTAQGAFFANTCQHLAEALGEEPASVTNRLASTFAIWYLGLEMAFKASFTALTQFGGMSNGTGFAVYAVLAFLATVCIAVGNDAPPMQTPARASFCGKALGALSMWTDPKIWLISGSNIAFGFSAAYLAGYINANWLQTAITKATGDAELAQNLIGFLGALICLIATISSKIFQCLNARFGSKIPVVALGSLCFIAIGVLSFIKAPHGEGPGGWGWGIVVFYLLQGMARGVYESTNKSVFADTYSGPKATGAFANAMLQNTASSTIGFLMGVANVDTYEAYPLLIFAALTVPMLVLAERIKGTEEARLQAQKV